MFVKTVLVGGGYKYFRPDFIGKTSLLKRKKIYIYYYVLIRHFIGTQRTK